MLARSPSVCVLRLPWNGPTAPARLLQTRSRHTIRCYKKNRCSKFSKFFMNLCEWDEVMRTAVERACGEQGVKGDFLFCSVASGGKVMMAVSVNASLEEHAKALVVDSLRRTFFFLVDEYVFYPSKTLLLNSRPSLWLRQQAAGCCSLIFDCTWTLLVTSVQRVVDSYPWKERGAMNERVAPLCHCLIARHGTEIDYNDALDSILPTPYNSFSFEDWEFVERDVVTHTGRSYGTLLELYESVYEIVTLAKASQAPPSVQVQCLYRLVFDDDAI